LIAILASERSPALLTKLFQVFDSVIDSLIGKGEWGLLENVVILLYDSEALRSDLSESHKQQLADLLTGFGRPERLKLVETYLNKTPDANTDGLSTVLLHLRNQDVPALCTLLANLQVSAHQIIVCETLAELARQSPEPILRGLTDRRAGYVRNLLTVMTKWNDPRHVDAIERIIRYPDPAVRKEVLRILGTLRPKGNGTKFVGMLSDPEDSVRHAALRLLTTGNYTTPYAAWEPILAADEFYDRSSTERRSIFHALCLTAREEAAPYWTKVLTEWSWTNRKKKEETAVIAAEALGKAGTPSALAALEIGQRKGNAAIREACSTALRVASKHQPGSEAKSA
jgi:HEAT repeat protein